MLQLIKYKFKLKLVHNSFVKYTQKNKKIKNVHAYNQFDQ